MLKEIQIVCGLYRDEAKIINGLHRAITKENKSTEICTFTENFNNKILKIIELWILL